MSSMYEQRQDAFRILQSRRDTVEHARRLHNRASWAEYNGDEDAPAIRDAANRAREMWLADPNHLPWPNRKGE